MNFGCRSQPAYEQVIASYHTGVSQALLEANAYLRNPTSGFLGRRFQIYVDLLGAPNQIQTRSYKDDYFVVVTPSLRTRRSMRSGTPICTTCWIRFRCAISNNWTA